MRGQTQQNFTKPLRCTAMHNAHASRYFTLPCPSSAAHYSTLPKQRHTKPMPYYASHGKTSLCLCGAELNFTLPSNAYAGQICAKPLRCTTVTSPCSAVAEPRLTEPRRRPTTHRLTTPMLYDIPRCLALALRHVTLPYSTKPYPCRTKPCPAVAVLFGAVLCRALPPRLSSIVPR
jgi:hypothetical protein